MKTHHTQNKPQQKPIKYKQFIQQLQNSSRSSIQDQSILSQRSFRQSYTSRDFKDQLKNQTGFKLSQKEQPFKLNDMQSSSKISDPSSNQNEQKRSDPTDKLYTFCDAKLTERSIQIVNQSNSKTKTQQTISHRQGQNQKYFKTNKQRNEHKENIHFVNQILQKIQTGGFEGKVLKTQASQLQNLQKSTKKSPEPILLTKKQSVCSNAITQSSSNQMAESNSNRKIQSVKKIFVLARQSSNRASNKKLNSTKNMSEQKSRENSVLKIQGKTQAQKESQQKCSSKKKIVSLNINPLKSSVNGQNNIRLKLSLDKSSERHNQQRQKSINMQTRVNFNLSSRGSLVEARILSSSMQKMPSLDHSKIENLNEGSRSNLLMSKTQLSELAGLLPKQPNQEVQKLRKTVEEYRQKQKKLGKQIYELNQRLKHCCNHQEKRETQILQKDCARLTNSYKQMKKFYELTLKEKEQLQSQIQTITGQNSDLKECLDFKSHQISQLTNKIIEMTQHIEQLQHQLQNRAFPSQLQGLSEIIKQKLGQYQNEISSLLDQNHKLTLLRQKLQNYNQTLNDQIEQKDTIIDSLQRQLKDVTNLRRSSKQSITDYKQTQMRLTKLCKQLQSKLKLSNIHNDYLTQQILSLKHQKKHWTNKNNNNTGSVSHAMLNGTDCHSKINNFSTLANTITTRNSSISHNNDHFDHFPHKHKQLNEHPQKREHHQKRENYTTQEQLQ